MQSVSGNAGRRLLPQQKGSSQVWYDAAIAASLIKELDL
jgi:hypothetical protein